MKSDACISTSETFQSVTHNLLNMAAALIPVCGLRALYYNTYECTVSYVEAKIHLLRCYIGKKLQRVNAEVLPGV